MNFQSQFIKFLNIFHFLNNHMDLEINFLNFISTNELIFINLYIQFFNQN